MKIIESFTVKNDCYKNNVSGAGSYGTFQSRGPLGLMLHSVGTPQPSAKVFCGIFNKAGLSKAVHAFIEPGVVYQTLPWNYRAWHAGGSANNTHIGIEMTEPSTIKYTSGSGWIENGDGKNTKAHVLGTYNTAVELFASLCKKYKLDPMKDGVIISHCEGNKRGVASNHGDPEHVWRKFGLTMDGFRKDVRDKMGEVESPAEMTPSYFRVKINTGSLNYRKGPGVSYGINGVVRSGEVYTIIAERDGWGQLKSGAGWINLKYTVRV